MKRKCLFVILGIVLLFLTGCGKGTVSNVAEKADEADINNTETVTAGDMPETEADTGLSEKRPNETQEGADKSEAERETYSAVAALPELPQSGKEFADFIPEGWEVLDCVELDFNEDGISDYVGVLEAAEQAEDTEYQICPRILFAVNSGGKDGYWLNFQDINLIRARAEGGVFGDPYLPLTADKTSFTTHAYGGSAWRWSEDYTYTYKEHEWRLTSSENTYGYGDYITSFSKDDWERGVGIRKQRSSVFGDMEQNPDRTDYDIEYEISMDEPPTIEQAGKRWWLAPDRVADWEVRMLTFTEGLSEEKIKRPNEAYIEYCDEDRVLYVFDDEADGICYLAEYRFKDKTISVPVGEKTEITDLKFYEGKIYYVTEITENVRYKTTEDGKEQITEEEDTVGIRLNRIKSNGEGKETVFEYRYPGKEGEVLEDRLPYMALIYEISGDEIVAEVYIGEEPHPFYRMKTDGSGLVKIGQIPKE